MFKIADSVQQFFFKLTGIHYAPLSTGHQCIFVPISSEDQAIYHYGISAHNKLWFHYTLRLRLSIILDDVTLFFYCKMTTGLVDVSFTSFDQCGVICPE